MLMTHRTGRGRDGHEAWPSARPARWGRANRPPASHRAERGAALVEFALCLPLLCVLVFGAVDAARAYTTAEEVQAAAREGAMYARRAGGAQQPGPGVCADPNNATWHAKHEAAAVTLQFQPSITGCVNDPGTLAAAGLGPGQPLRVTATAPFRFLTPFGNVVLGARDSISASVCVTIEGAAPAATPCP